MHLKAAAAVSALALLALGAGTTATAGGTTLHLGGSWAGTYSGAVSGKFTLTWTQTNGRLKGVIKLSAPSGTYGITGAVTRGKIKFGAVKVGAIYNGSVSASGLKMSGTWASGPGGGTWSAHKLLTVVKIKLPEGASGENDRGRLAAAPVTTDVRVSAQPQPVDVPQSRQV